MISQASVKSPAADLLCSYRSFFGEKLFGEGKRRTKVIPRFPTEKSCLTLFYATLIDSSKRWYGVRMSIDIMQELDKLWGKVMPEKNKSALLAVAKEVLAEENVLVGH